ncbi:MAG: glycoside hydrolase family 43 protein [Cyclobacteriaceae bacterium]|nr:glycoside hydrolase family 43 protein [Cyclobacteriaceae bacterium]
MYRILFYLITLSLFSNCQQADEPEIYLFSYFTGNGEDGLHLAISEDGYTWKALKDGDSFLIPTAGKDKLMRDPCIIQTPDGRFHMVWTVSWNEKGIGYAWSDDLIHWSDQKYIPVMEHEPNARNCWAPEVTYDPDGRQYMIYWATTIDGLFPDTYVESDRGYNHRMYYVTTSDFENFSSTHLLYEPGFNVIDANIVRHEGEYLMFLKDETREPPAKNLHLARSANITGPYSAPEVQITGDYWAEGPSALMVDGKWMVYFDKYTQKKMGAVISEDLIHWTDVSDQVSFPEGTRHGTAFKVKSNIGKALLAL